MKKMLLLLLAVSINANAQLTGDIKNNFMNSVYDSCYKSQKSNLGYKNVPDITIKKYCKCASVYSANVLTNQIVKDIESGKQDGTILNNIVILGGKYCMIHYPEY
jgi:hypothetical protein